MAAWFWYAIGAAVLYGLHQVFTKLASERIGEGLGGFVVEASAALMAIIGIAFFKEPAPWQNLLGIVFSIAGLFLLRYSQGK